MSQCNPVPFQSLDKWEELCHESEIMINNWVSPYVKCFKETVVVICICVNRTELNVSTI